MNAKEVLNVAAQTERDGINFYRSAAAGASNELARKMFDSFVSEEGKHLALIEDVMAKRRVQHASSKFLADVKTVFTSTPKSLRDKLPATADDLKAIDFALEIEKKSYDFYSKWQGEADAPEVRDLCGFLAGEENKHFRLFSNLKEYLDRTADWFMVEEGWNFD
jgi:rubrerythrin